MIPQNDRAENDHSTKSTEQKFADQDIREHSGPECTSYRDMVLPSDRKRGSPTTFKNRCFAFKSAADSSNFFRFASFPKICAEGRPRSSEALEQRSVAQVPVPEPGEPRPPRTMLVDSSKKQRQQKSASLQGSEKAGSEKPSDPNVQLEPGSNRLFLQ